MHPNYLARGYQGLNVKQEKKKQKQKHIHNGLTSCGGTSKVIVLKSIFVMLSMQGNIKNRPVKE